METTKYVVCVLTIVRLFEICRNDCERCCGRSGSDSPHIVKCWIYGGSFLHSCGWCPLWIDDMPFVKRVSVLRMDSFLSGEVHGVIDTTPVEHS